jgi:osmotically-inducible protein OsmY
MTDARLKKVLIHTVLFGAVALSLQGCIEMAIGTAVVSTLAATDRRTFGAQTEDKAIVLKGENKVANAFPGAHLNVTSFNRKVLVTGEVKDEATKASVERELAAIEGVQSVANEVAVASVSNYTSRSNDALITTKVKASLVDQKDLSSNAVKVVTENGVVYLMGRVTPGEGKMSGEITSGVSGVRKVVKLFEYITDEDLARLVKGS